MKKRLFVSMFLCAVLVLLCACAGTQLKDPSEMTPKEKSTYAMKLFVKQTQDLQAMEKYAGLTPEQKAVLAKKKEVLKQAAIGIDLYNSYIDGGLQPTPALEAGIMEIINKLLIN